jgi:hypothetical protein
VSKIRILSTLVVASLITWGASAQQLSPNMPFDVANLSNSSKPSSADWNDLAWQSFVAANWPVAKGTRGTPDPSQKIGAMDGAMPVPVVWMTSKSPPEVFLPNGAAPDPNWDKQQPEPLCQNVSGYDPATSYVLRMVSKGSSLSVVNQAGFPGSGFVMGPLIDQFNNYVWYDIRMSQSEFAYFLETRYYNSGNQVQDVNNPGAFRFPPVGRESYVQNLPPAARYGAVEYKASWRVLDPNVDIVSRYFSVQAFVVGPDSVCRGPTLMGLTGLHILRLTPSTPGTWYWATFEQVDNLEVPNPPPTRPDGKPLTPSFGDGKTYPGGHTQMPDPVMVGQPLPPGKAVGVSRVTPIQAASAAANQTYRQLLAGTVWENYQLIGVQNPANPVFQGVVQGNDQGTGQCYAAGTGNDTNARAQINDCYLANVTMETYVQATSCVTCHSYGAPLGVARVNGRPTFGALARFQAFTFMYLEAKPELK